MNSIITSLSSYKTNEEHVQVRSFSFFKLSASLHKTAQYSNMKPAIAILGAGPSGLALARLLTVKNIDCVIFEREKSPDAVGQGGCLDIHTDSGQLVLKEAGLFDKFKALARYDGQAFKVVDRNGNVTFENKYQGQEGRPEIDRKDLRRMLLDSVPSETIQWDAQVKKVNREADGSMTVHFANGNFVKGFRLVVGADGTWSKARSMVCPPH